MKNKSIFALIVSSAMFLAGCSNCACFTPSQQPTGDQGGDTTTEEQPTTTTEEQVVDNYRIVGNFTNWTYAASNYNLEEDSSKEGYSYSFKGIELTTNDFFKIVDNLGTWYPGGMGNDYTVEEDGTYDIYFTPTPAAGSDYVLIEEQDPTVPPTTTSEEDPTTSEEDPTTTSEEDPTTSEEDPTTTSEEDSTTSAEDSTTSEEDSTTSEEEQGKYGSELYPLTVAQVLDLADEVLESENHQTEEEVYVQAIVDDRPSGNQYGYRQFHLVDERGDAEKLYVYTVNKYDTYDSLYQNDMILLRGYFIAYGQNLDLEISNVGSDYPQALSVTRGLSFIDYSDHEHASIQGLEDTATNGTELSFTVNVDSGWKLDAVKVNNKPITMTEGVYSFTVAGDMEVELVVSEEGSLSEHTYVLDGSVTGGSNGYATVSEIEQGGKNWAVTANTTIDPWRFGGKSIDHETRRCESVEPMTTESENEVYKVEVAIGAITITVDSITLLVGSDQGESDIDEVEPAAQITANSTLVFEKPAEADWTGAYFTIAFEVTNSTSTNQYVQMKTATFFYLA